MSFHAFERDLGIDRATARNYPDADGPQPRQPRAKPTTSSSQTGGGSEMVL